MRLTAKQGAAPNFVPGFGSQTPTFSVAEVCTWALRKRQPMLTTPDPGVHGTQKADGLTTDRSCFREERDRDVTDELLMCQYTNPASQTAELVSYKHRWHFHGFLKMWKNIPESGGGKGEKRREERTCCCLQVTHNFFYAEQSQLHHARTSFMEQHLIQPAGSLPQKQPLTSFQSTWN